MISTKLLTNTITRSMMTTVILLTASLALAQENANLPEGAVARLGVHRLRVPAAINDTAFTPDGGTFVVVQADEKGERPCVVLFDAATGRERKRLDIFQAQQIAMARDRPIMAVQTKKGFEMWDLETEKRVRQWPLPKDVTPYRLALSPDGTRIANIVFGGKLMILRFDAGEAMPLPPIEPTTAVTTVQFTPDGKTIIAFAPQVNSAISIFDARTGALLTQRENRSNYTIFSPDGTRFARTVNEKRIEVIELASGKGVAELSVAHSQFTFAPDSKQLAIVAGERIQLWDLDANSAREIEGTVWARNIAPCFSPDGKRLAVVQYENNNINYVQFWDVPTGKAIRFPGGHPGTVNGLAFSPDGRQLATISKDTLVIYDPKSGEERRRWVAHAASIEQIAYGPDGQLLASASVDGTIGLWHPDTGKERRRLTAKDHVKSIAFTRDGATLIAVSKDQTVQCWDVAKGTLVHQYKLDTLNPAPQLAPLGDQIAHFKGSLARRSTAGATLHRVHARTGKMLESIDLRRAPDTDGIEGTLTWAFAFAPDSKLIATSDSLQTFDLRMSIANHTVRVWETATCKEIVHFANNPVATRLLALSPDGRILAHGVGERGVWGSGTDKTVILRDISAAQSHDVGGFGGRSGAPDPAGLLKLHRPLDGHQGSITCLAFSPDGKLLATGGSDQVVYLWRVADFWKPPALPAVKDAAELWPTLGDPNAARAYHAMTRLERAPKETSALLRAHLQPVPSADAPTIARHVRDLASSNFAVRQQAYAALEKSGAQAAHLLQDALKDPHSLEVRRRIETLLDKQERPFQDASQLRAYRALTLLERIGTPEARKLLEELAQGAPAAWLTIEARHSLLRLPSKE